MTDDKAKWAMVNEERTAGLHEIEKFKESYARYMIADKEKITNYIAHPHVITKKEIRKWKIRDFFNKVKKAIGL